ncbi:MAG: DUF4249 domain-containing protein [Bacteroidales bacterium]|nr:DUF4249 domain-containing protein [Bacteroidales bacterium]
MVALLILIPGCIEPYNPDISRYEDILVVDGTFTNIEEDQYLILSRTYGYYESENKMETGAVVVIRNNEGITGTYTEIDDGVYLLQKGTFSGETGKSYQIIIETSDGKHYESGYELLKKPVEIDSVFYDIELDKETLSGEKYDGLQIYLTSGDENNETHYYRWDWEETWEFMVPFVKPGFQNRIKCWRTIHSTNITIASTLNLKEDLIYKQKLNFVTSRNSKLSRVYSILVRQYSLTPEAFDFWRKLELSNEHTGSLFDPPPTPVTGNIENTEDPYEPVLGYFQVSGVSEKRIFIKRSVLPAVFDLTTGNEHCSSLEVMGEGIEEVQDGWYLLQRYTWMDTIWTSLSSHIDCYDCTQRGENVQPEYWIDSDE